jgi:hypothetical protein
VNIGISKTIISPVILYGCETWSLTLRENLEYLEYKFPMRIFGPRGDKMVGGWRILHNEELHNLYSSLCIIRMITLGEVRWSRHVARLRQKSTAYRDSVGNPKGKSH